ncbi:MAG: hypothetical protein KAX65_04165 [Caldilineaceae bacterium]|nr:hypothetical protein [Caldilineaceae bacterium]
MALPTIYTDATLKSYMLAYLGAIGTTLGLTTASFDEGVNDVLLAYPATTLAQATDIAKVRALAKVAAVRHAQTVASTWYDFSADGASFSRSQVLAALSGMLALAETDAMSYADAYAIGIGSMAYPDDPYPLTVVDLTENDDSEVF